MTQQCNLARPTWVSKPGMLTRDGALCPAVEAVLRGHSGLTACGVLLTPFCEMEYRKTAADCQARGHLQPTKCQSGCLVLASTRWVFSLRTSLQFLNGLPPQTFLCLVVSVYGRGMPVDLSVRVSVWFCLFKVGGWVGILEYCGPLSICVLGVFLVIRVNFITPPHHWESTHV